MTGQGYENLKVSCFVSRERLKNDSLEPLFPFPRRTKDFADQWIEGERRRRKQGWLSFSSSSLDCVRFWKAWKCHQKALKALRHRGALRLYALGGFQKDKRWYGEAKYSAIRTLLIGALVCLDSFLRTGRKERQMTKPSQCKLFHVILINVPAAWAQPIGSAHLGWAWRRHESCTESAGGESFRAVVAQPSTRE
jgi:hypothetical protein